jgi:very-short-patch-repair endonuclease
VRQAELLRLRLGPEIEPLGTRSDLEDRFLRHCRRHRLPRPEVNAKVGEFEVDFLWRDRRLIVELDSFRFHGTRSGFEADRARDVRLKLLGYEVFRFTDRQLDDDPAAIASALRRLTACNARADSSNR